MRRALIVGIIFFTIFSTFAATASSLMVYGGTIQSFIYEANIPASKPQPRQKREDSRPPESRTAPERNVLERNFLVVDSGVGCSEDETIWICISNPSTEPINELSWGLYLDGKQIQAEELASIQAQEVYTITVVISQSGTYQFSLEKKGDQDPGISTLSEEILVDGDSCPTLFAYTATATIRAIEAAIEVRNQITPTPFSPLSTPSPGQNTATVQPSPSTIPQATPTQAVPTLTPTGEITVTISPTAANSPGVSEDTSALDPTQTQTVISSSP